MPVALLPDVLSPTGFIHQPQSDLLQLNLASHCPLRKSIIIKVLPRI